MDFDSIEGIRAYFADDEFARKCLGATIDDYDFETGIATVSMEIDDRHHNAQGFVMGGVFFSLADYALAVASNVNQPPSASTNSRVWASLRLGSSDRDSQTGRPGWFKPSIAPGLGQWAVIAVPSSSTTSAKKRL